MEAAMSRKAIAIFVGLFLGGGTLLAAGAARFARWDGLRPAPTMALTAARTAAGTAVVGELKVNIREWTVPTKGAHPHDPAVAPDGSLWFTEQLQNKLGRLDPESGTFKEYALKIEDSGPHG